MLPQPDPNRSAPRPSARTDTSEQVPDMDHPPPAQSHDQPSFDRANAAADDEARAGEPTRDSHTPPADESSARPAGEKSRP